MMLMGVFWRDNTRVMMCKSLILISYDKIINLLSTHFGSSVSGGVTLL